MRSAVACCGGMPDPGVDQRPWFARMQSPLKWKQALASFVFFEASFGSQVGVDDSKGLVPAVVGPSHAWYARNVCEHKFPSERALLSHQRAKHGKRVEQRYYSNRHGICQVCKTQFHTHARLLRHLTDRRRTRCWSMIREHPEHFEKLSEDDMSALDAWYREQKVQAWKHGHSHIMSAKPAMTAGGKMIGHVQR